MLPLPVLADKELGEAQRLVENLMAFDISIALAEWVEGSGEGYGLAWHLEAFGFSRHQAGRRGQDVSGVSDLAKVNLAD